MPELALPNQTFKFQQVLDDILAPWTPINLPFASLEPCGLAGCFEYNKPYICEYFFSPQGGPSQSLGENADTQNPFFEDFHLISEFYIYIYIY